MFLKLCLLVADIIQLDAHGNAFRVFMSMQSLTLANGIALHITVFVLVHMVI